MTEEAKQVEAPRGLPPERLDDGSIEEACARHAHETNGAFVAALGVDQQPWRWLQDGERMRLRTMVKAILHDDLTAEKKHTSWCDRRRAEGWNWGPVKDTERKLDPMLKSWDDLPPTQQAKDTLVVASVNALAMTLGHSKRPLAVRELLVERKKG
jgi:RyR domain